MTVTPTTVTPTSFPNNASFPDNNFPDNATLSDNANLHTYAPPHNLDAEKSVIGSVLIDNDAYVLVEEVVRGDQFYAPRHQKIWTCISSLSLAGEPIDLVTLADELRKRGVLEEVGSIAYLIGLMDGVPTAAYAESYARIVAEKARLRRVIAGAGEIIRKASEGVELKDVLAEVDTFATEAVTGISSGTTDDQAFDAAMGYLDGSVKVKTGFSALDRNSGGLSVGDLTTIAARSTVGKSSLVYQIAIELTNKTGKPVGILSPDQEKGEIFSILAARVAGSSLSDIEETKDKALQNRYTAAVRYVRQHISPRLIIRDGMLRSTQIETEFNKLMRQGCGAVIVDTLQAVDEGKEFKKTQIDNTCRTLKGLARHYRIPVIAVSQIKQDVDYRDNKRPRDYDCSDSKNIYDLSRTMIFLYREGLYSPPVSVGIGGATEVVEARFAKQKVGKKNAVAQLIFHAKTQTFRNPTGAIPGITIAGQPFAP